MNVEVHHGTNATGNYNHAAMLDYHNGVFLVAWKNGPFNEDKSGQRILYVKSQSQVLLTCDSVGVVRVVGEQYILVLRVLVLH